MVSCEKADGARNEHPLPEQTGPTNQVVESFELLIGDWIFRGIGSGRGVADRKLDFQWERIWEGLARRGRWELDELAVNESILRWRRVRIMMGTSGGERLRRKGGFRARIEALLAVWGQAARGGAERIRTSGSLGVKAPAFLELR